MGGYPVLDLTIRKVEPNAPVALAVPETARSTAERVVAEKVTEGVWFLGGGSHNSILIELADPMLLVEAPLSEARVGAVFEQAKALVPNKSIRTVVNSHQHFDHAGGLRAAIAEGATIVTHADNAAYYERAFTQPSTVGPDRMAVTGKRPVFRTVNERLDIGDATRAIELHRIAGGPHSESMLMVWLPLERLLIEADAYSPLPPNTPPPATPNASHVNLIDNIERLKLDVDRILPLHGRVAPVGDLCATARRAKP